jgi:hypothetical protein
MTEPTPVLTDDLKVTPPQAVLSYATATDLVWFGLIRLLGWIGVIAGAAGILAGLLGLPMGLPFVVRPRGTIGLCLMCVGMAVSALEIVAGIGLLRLRAWGRAAAITFAYISMVYAVIAIGISLSPFLYRELRMAASGSGMGFRGLRIGAFLLVQLGNLVPWAVYPIMCIALLRTAAGGSVCLRGR